MDLGKITNQDTDCFKVLSNVQYLCQSPGKKRSCNLPNTTKVNKHLSVRCNQRFFCEYYENYLNMCLTMTNWKGFGRKPLPSIRRIIPATSCGNCVKSLNVSISIIGFPAEIGKQHLQHTNLQLTATRTYPVTRYYVCFLFSRLSGRSSRLVTLPFISLPSSPSKPCLPESHKKRRYARCKLLYHFSAIK